MWSLCPFGTEVESRLEHGPNPARTRLERRPTRLERRPDAGPNGGHSFSRDGVRWLFSNATAYTKNISWTATGPNANNTEPWTVMARRERPGLLLDAKWESPLALFSAVAAHTWRRNVLPRWAEAHQSYGTSLPLR